jgi:uncharacterized repeat protein (TIGR03803 family)
MMNMVRCLPLQQVSVPCFLQRRGQIGKESTATRRNRIGRLSCVWGIMWQWRKKACAVFALGAMAAAALPAQTLTLLHSFSGTDASEPATALVEATNGDLYGTTLSGAANGAYGTVFKITTGGRLTKLHSFAGYPTDGYYPNGALVQAAKGLLRDNRVWRSQRSWRNHWGWHRLQNYAKWHIDDPI